MATIVAWPVVVALGSTASYLTIRVAFDVARPRLGEAFAFVDTADVLGSIAAESCFAVFWLALGWFGLPYLARSRWSRPATVAALLLGRGVLGWTIGLLLR